MKKILIVNDCRFESLIIKDCLNDIGYSVEVTNEYDVFLQIRRFQPDIVIANLIMKDTTGDKLIEYIKSTNPGIICLLSSCDIIKLEDFVEQKVDEVIHTPVNEFKLSEILNKALSITENSDVDVSRQRIKESFGKTGEKNSKHDNVHVLNEASKDRKNNEFSFCPYCGAKLTILDKKILFCPYCGQKIKN